MKDSKSASTWVMLSGMVLLQRSRLSVQPVEPQHYALIVKLAGA